MSDLREARHRDPINEHIDSGCMDHIVERNDTHGKTGREKTLQEQWEHLKQEAGHAQPAGTDPAKDDVDGAVDTSGQQQYIGR
jgi:hypothetical protein